MSTQFRDARSGGKMACCTNCGHDLGVKKGDHSGLVYCTNTGCPHFKRPHKTGSELNTGIPR